MKFHRFVLALAASTLGILCWQRSWIAAAAAAAVCVWLILDDHALDRLDDHDNRRDARKPW